MSQRRFFVPNTLPTVRGVRRQFFLGVAIVNTFCLSMIEASEEVALFAIALRGICATQEQQLGLGTTESENECVDILCRTSNTSPCSWIYIKISQ